MAPAGLRVPPGGRWHGGEGSSHQTPRPTRRCLPSSLHAPCSNMQKKKQNPGCEATACGGASAPPALPLVLTVAWFFFFGGAAGEGEGRRQELRDEGSWDVHSSEAPATGGNWVEIGFFFLLCTGSAPHLASGCTPKTRPGGEAAPQLDARGGAEALPTPPRLLLRA